VDNGLAEPGRGRGYATDSGFIAAGEAATRGLAPFQHQER
jgi:hypothetical protein